MELISIKRAMKAIDQRDTVQSLVAAHAGAQETILTALKDAAALLAEEAAAPFQKRMEYLRERLGFDHRPEAIEENGRDISEELERFARECQHERERKAWESRQVIQTLAEAASALTQTGTAQSDRLSELGARIAAISRLDSMAEMRHQLAVRVDEIKALSRQADERGQRLAASIETKMRRAEERLAAAQRLAETDPLTEIGNRRMAENAIEAAIAAGTPLSLILCDLDEFKQVNDVYGHQVGDQALKAVAQAVKNGVRSSDVVCRWGGDEFVIIILDQTFDTVQNIAGAIAREAFGLFQLKTGDRETDIPLSASIGAAEYRPGEPAFDFFDRADRMMYEKKLARRTAGPVEAGANVSHGFLRRPSAPPAGDAYPVDRRRSQPVSARASATPAIGSFIVNNHTRAAMTVDVAGTTYSIPPGTFVIRLPSGQYNAKVVTRFGTSRLDLTVTAGSAYTGNYACPSA